MNRYLITDRAYYLIDLTRLRDILVRHRPDFAVYRDKESCDYSQGAVRFLEICSEFESIKTMLHGDIDLAFTLGAYGVHLTSLQFDEIKKAKEVGLFTVISCHSEIEILKAQKSGADAVTYSPVFNTPNKGEPKGLAELQRMVDKMSIPIIALGGITTDIEVKAVESTGCYGFASIRYFVD